MAMEELKAREGYIINKDTTHEERWGDKTIRYVPLWQWVLGDVGA